jgi:GH24 family phage-related lysozyme (muramidase)
MYTIPERIAAANPDTAGQALAAGANKNDIMASIHVADIATIVAVDTTTNTVTAKPIANSVLVDNQGIKQSVDQPTIPDTPYIGTNPAIGGYCLLIYCDHDISAILTLGGLTGAGTPQSQNSQLQQSHSLNHAVAILFQSSAITPTVAPANYGASISPTGNNGTGVSESLIAFIKTWEGLQLNWYSDATGTPTIGYGHASESETLPSGFTAPLTLATADALLRYDLTYFITSVQSMFSGFTLKQNQFDALVDFAWGYGPSTLASSTLKADILAGADSTTIKNDFDAYSYSKGVFLAGLLRRQDANWAMFCNDTYLPNG